MGKIFQRSIEYKGVEIEDVMIEAFKGIFIRILVTAERGLKPSDIESPWLEDDELRWIAYRATATPAIVVGRIEAGIEKFVNPTETPDGRNGVVIQYWYSYDASRPIDQQVNKFWKEVSIRIRQDILSCSGGTSRVFNYVPKELAVGYIDTYELVGKCGGGYEKVIKKYDGRDMIVIPLMSGFDFEIERCLGYGIGIAGSTLWIFCTDVNACREACREAVKRLYMVEGCIAPFGACPSGSLPEYYPPIGPPTNYYYCPSLKNILKDMSKVPEGVKSIFEIVINAISIEHLIKAFRECIETVVKYPEVVGISAANYGGRLGQLMFNLTELLR